MLWIVRWSVFEAVGRRKEKLQEKRVSKVSAFLEFGKKWCCLVQILFFLDTYRLKSPDVA